MINLNMFTNPNEVTRKEFEELVKANDLAVLTQESLKKINDDTQSLLEKAQVDGINEKQEKDVELIKAQLEMFIPIKIRENNLTVTEVLVCQKSKLNLDKRAE